MKFECWNRWRFSLWRTETRSSVSHHTGCRCTRLHERKQTFTPSKIIRSSSEKSRKYFEWNQKLSRLETEKFNHFLTHERPIDKEGEEGGNERWMRVTLENKTPILLSGSCKHSLFFSLYPSFPHQTKFWHCCPPAAPTLHFLSIISLFPHRRPTLTCWLVLFCLLNPSCSPVSMVHKLLWNVTAAISENSEILFTSFSK